jgi:hypothetical protein
MRLEDIKLEPLLDTLRMEKIDDSIYFGSPVYKNRISNSRLGLLNPRQGGSPEKFFGGFKSTFNPSFALGSAVHEQVLQPELFKLAEDTGKPTAKMGGMADELYDIYCQREITNDDIIKASDKIDYYKGKMTPERIAEVRTKCATYWETRCKNELDIEETKEIRYLDYPMLEKAKSCIESLQSNKFVMDLLHPKGIIEDPISECEQAILLDMKATMPNGKEVILHLKAKLDNFTIDTESNIIKINDVKTHGQMLNTFDEAKVKYHYNREIAMYMYLLGLIAKHVYKLDAPKKQANYLVVSTVPNFYSKVVPLTFLEIRDGFHEFQTLLRYSAYLMCYKGYSFDEQPGKYQL